MLMGADVQTGRKEPLWIFCFDESHTAAVPEYVW